MNHRRICTSLLVLAVAAHAVAAVSPNDNLVVNGEFRAEQDVRPQFWEFSNNCELGWRAEGGPGDKPYVTMECNASSAEISIRQGGVNLVSGGVYRVSAWVKACGFSAKRGRCAGFGWFNGLKLVTDTGGEWRHFSTNVLATVTGATTIYIWADEPNGKLALADLRVNAVNDIALAESQLPAAVRAIYEPRLVVMRPRLGAIPKDDPRLEVRFFGRVPRGKRDDYDVIARIEETGEQTATPLSDNTVHASVPASTASGVLALSLVRRSTGETVSAKRYRYAFADIPRNITKGRPLNNLCSELVNATVTGGCDRFSFVFGRSGWVFLSAKGRVTLDGVEVVSPDSPRGESFRFLSPGRHDLVVSAASGSRIIVRSIAEIFNYCPGVDSRVPGNGSYGWDFQEKYVHPAVTTQNSGLIDPERRSEFLRRGYHWIDNMSTVGVTGDALKGRLMENPSMKDGFHHGVSCDEQSFTAVGALEAYAKGLRDFDLEFRPDRAVYTWAYGGPLADGVDQEFFEAMLNEALGKGRFLPELYRSTRRTEGEALKAVDDGLRKRYAKFIDCYPSAGPSIVVVLSNFNQIPVLSHAYYPHVDFKRHLDLQVHMLATDPVFKDVGGVGFWGSYYADEEIHRWSFALMRHYVVEGRTELLSDRYGYRYVPGHLSNGDFENGFEGWKTTGAVRLDGMKDFGRRAQNRWGNADAAGDAFAVLTKGDGVAASIRQTISGLTPGRIYSLQMSTFDVKDVKASRVAPRRLGIDPMLGKGAELVREGSFVFVDDRKKVCYEMNNGVARTNLHRVLFRATAEKVELVIHNDKAEPGEELGVNCISVNPYFAR